MERERKLALLTSSKLGALRHVEEVLARLGRDYDDVDFKLALGETFFRACFAQQKAQVDKALAGLPANAPLSQILKRLGVQMRENRGIPCPAAVTRIRRALEDGTFPSLRKAADFSGINERTLRNVLKNERAEEGTLYGISKALKIPFKTLISDQEPQNSNQNSNP